MTDRVVVGKPATYYKFDPQPDITVYELADLLAELRLTANPEVYRALGSLKRHFRKVEG